MWYRILWQVAKPKLIYFIIAFVLFLFVQITCNAQSQTFRYDGVTYELPKSNSSEDSKPEKVGETVIDGKKYPIYKGKRGGLYIIRTSKEGKERREYLKKKESK